MQQNWIEILPNVYRDKFENTIRFDTIPEFCYYIQLKDFSRKQFFTIEELINYYNNKD